MVRLIDSPNRTSAVYCGHKATNQSMKIDINNYFRNVKEAVIEVFSSVQEYLAANFEVFQIF